MIKKDNDQTIFTVSAEAKEDNWIFAKHTLLQFLCQLKDKDIHCY